MQPADNEAGIARAASLAPALRTLTYFRGHGPELLTGFLLLCVTSGVTLGRPMILRFMIDFAIGSIGTGDLGPVYRYSGLFIALLLVGVLAGYAQIVVMSRLGLSIVNRIKADLFRHILSLDLAFFDRHRVGWLISRVESDAEQLKNFCSHVTVRLLMEGLVFVGIIAIIYRTDAEIAAWLALLVAIMLVVIVTYVSRLRRIYDAVRAKYAELTGFLSEYIQGVPVIQLYNRKAEIRAALDLRNGERFDSQVRAALYDYGFWAAFTFATETILIAVILWFGMAKVSAGTMSVGTVVMLLEYVRQVIAPIHHFSEQFNEIQRAFVAAERVFGILDMKAAIVDGTGDDGGRVIPESVEFRNVGFAYKPGEPVLRDVSFTLARGEKIAIVGPSGGGKTTLASLLCRFYDPTAGAILVNGRDLRELPVRAWRRCLGLVLQDIFLFPGTIADNLRILDTAVPDAAVERAARTIGADRVIRRFPDGYGTLLSERGGNLSMGERQLLSFTRALTFEPDILVLDEATASIDPATERMVQEALERLLAGRTAVIVAHRLSTVRFADRILVVEGGRITESGTHAELLALGGTYRKLHDLQSVDGPDPAGTNLVAEVRAAGTGASA